MGEHQQILLSIHIPENELCLCGSSENTTVVRSRCRCLLFNVHIVHELGSSSSSKHIETEPNEVGQQLTDSRVCISDCSVLRQIYSERMPELTPCGTIGDASIRFGSAAVASIAWLLAAGGRHLIVHRRTCGMWQHRSVVYRRSWPFVVNRPTATSSKCTSFSVRFVSAGECASEQPTL